ncbi:FAD/NAD(P)-binding domain-containing protein [Hysterangium stoloniferum]|nr:FAD/NAD(P)-binding domain-containing protein [Hysterangium stoloniferum]
MTPDALYLGRKAAVSLKFVVVGGGPSGLAAAYALTKAGHKCVVLERANVIGQCHGAFNVPSNLTKIFAQWGIAEHLDAIACKPLGIEFLKYRSGERFGGIKWNELVFDATGKDYYIADQADVHRLLFDLTRDAGVDIRLGCKVSKIDPVAPSVMLETGEIIYGDIVIGADGDQSIVRDVVLEEHVPGVSKGMAVFISTIPVEKMMDDPELKALVETPLMNEWMGPDRIMLALPIKEAGLYVVYLLHPSDIADSNEDWTTSDSVELYRKQVEGWEPRVQKILQLIDHTADVKQVRREPYDTWIHRLNRVVLVGDACHPMPAYGLQKAAMAIEDAAVLGNLFSRLKRRDNIVFILQAYQELRQSRCAYVQGREDNAHVTFPLREGTDEDLDGRDEELREKYLSKDITPEKFQELWEKSAEIFRYEVELEAEGWWRDFGPLMSPQDDRRVSVLRDIGVSRRTVVEPVAPFDKCVNGVSTRIDVNRM